MFSFPNKLYPISDTGIAGISHAEQVARLSAGGARVIQLREKQLAARQFFEEAAVALAIARQSGTKIIINDRADLALALGADGVHLGQDDLPPDAARRLLGPDAIIGFSTHSVEQARLAAQLPISYLAIGPIYATRTKANPDPVVGLNGLRQVREVTRGIPLVAIGGITCENAAPVIAAGADALAIVSALLTEGPNISLAASRFLEILTV